MGNFKSNMLVPMKWAGQDRKFADSVKENLDVITGNRGDPLDRAITARDLLESDIGRRGVCTFSWTSGAVAACVTGGAIMGLGMGCAVMMTVVFGDTSD